MVPRELGWWLVFVALLAGCMSLGPEEIAKRMEEKYESIQDYEGTKVVTSIIDGEERVSEKEFKFKKPWKHWSRDKETGKVVVSNGSTVWIYSPRKNEVRIMELKGMEEQLDLDFRQFVEDMLENFEVKLLGSQKVVERDCYILQLLPREDGQGGTHKLWVDKEYWMPLRIESEFRVGNRTAKTVIIYKEIRFNAGIPDEDFEFQIPEGARIKEREIKLPQKLTLEEAKKKAGFEIKLPGYLPEGYGFEHAWMREGRGEKGR